MKSLRNYKAGFVLFVLMINFIVGSLECAKASVDNTTGPNIVWISYHGADNAPSAGAAAAGFTEAPDKGYTDLLAANGYNVTRYITTRTPDASILNAADLVIIGRSVSSAAYENDGATAWHSITAPMIVMCGYTLRIRCMGYTTGLTMMDSPSGIPLTVKVPTHPIFSGISLTNDIMDNPFAGIAVYPTNGVTLARGISINHSPANTEGTVLAVCPAGGMVIGEWFAGSTMTHSGGAKKDTLAGHRLVFLSGSREAQGINSETAGLYDLFADGERMFLNAVKYMIPEEEREPNSSVWGSGSTVAINDHQFAGSATLTIREQSEFADLLVTLLEPPVVDANGTQRVVATHTFTFADGSSITTSDEETAVPTVTPGLYTLIAQMEVVSGTGIYEKVSGHLVADGTIDFTAQPPAAQFELAGTILEDTTGSGSTAAINDYQFAGTAMLNIHGYEKSADLLVTVLAEPEVDANGVHHVVATHTFTFADGSSITTSDEETAEPTATPGLYTLTAQMEVVSGTGIYEWCRGQLAAYGTIDFAAQPPAAQFDIAGAVVENTTGSGATAAINDYQFAGTAMLTIHGQEKSADLLVTVLAEPEVDANGVHHVVATHTFTFADGSSITTSDEETAVPTATPGLYTLTAQMEVVSGAGIYEGVRGQLMANGTIDFAAQPPAAQFGIVGAVLYCGDVNHPHPVGDLNSDCRVDYVDLALLCSHWLNDNNP